MGAGAGGRARQLLRQVLGSMCFMAVAFTANLNSSWLPAGGKTGELQPPGGLASLAAPLWPLGRQLQQPQPQQRQPQHLDEGGGCGSCSGLGDADLRMIAGVGAPPSCTAGAALGPATATARARQSVLRCYVGLLLLRQTGLLLLHHGLRVAHLFLYHMRQQLPQCVTWGRQATEGGLCQRGWGEGCTCV